MIQSNPRGAYWAEFPETYRNEQVAAIARWLAVGECGALVGGSGTGKSNLVGFLSSRPEVVTAQMPQSANPFILIHFDVNSLPALSATYFYRGLLSALQEAAAAFAAEEPEILEKLTTHIQQQTNWDDTFQVLMTLQAAHRILMDRTSPNGQMNIVWLLDRFDAASQQLDAQTLSSLRSLRDQFKGRLSYIVATRHPLERLCNPAEIDEFYELIAANTCWVGPMVERDARWIVRQMGERLGTPFTEAETVLLMEVSGGLPAFLKEACMARSRMDRTNLASATAFSSALAARQEFQRNCREIWADLEDDEQLVLSAIVDGEAGTVSHTNAHQYLNAIGLLTSKGEIFSPIFAEYVRQQRADEPRETEVGISLHPKTRSVLRDGMPLGVELTNHEDRLLAHFLDHTDEVCTKDALMNTIWPEDQVVEGIRDDRLAQLIKRLRDKIEPSPSNPTYVQTVRGRGYRFVQR